MIKKLFYTTALITGIIFSAYSQNSASLNKGVNNRVQNNVMGVSFAKIGNVVQVDSSTYNINLSSTETTNSQSSMAQVSTANRLYVDLPGSYGGKFYLDSPSAEKFVRNRIMTDSVNTGQLKFHRGYWAVYAGMGMWDCVINCYVQKNGKYYIVSLVQERQMGKPGEIINNKQLKAEDLKLKIVNSLQDSTNTTVNEFNKLLYSFQIQK